MHEDVERAHMRVIGLTAIVATMAVGASVVAAQGPTFSSRREIVRVDALVTLLYAIEQRNLKTGLATLCLGGGNAVALAVERV